MTPVSEIDRRMAGKCRVRGQGSRGPLESRAESARWTDEEHKENAGRAKKGRRVKVGHEREGRRSLLVAKQQIHGFIGRHLLLRDQGDQCAHIVHLALNQPVHSPKDWVQIWNPNPATDHALCLAGLHFSTARQDMGTVRKHNMLRMCTSCAPESKSKTYSAGVLATNTMTARQHATCQRDLQAGEGCKHSKLDSDDPSRQQHEQQS